MVRAVAYAYAPRADTVPLRSTGENPWQLALGIGSGSAFLVMLLTLIRGPRPRHATRRGWFWLYLAPANLGLFAALAIEGPWVRSAGPGRAVADRTGAFGILVVTSCAWGPVPSLVEALLR